MLSNKVLLATDFSDTARMLINCLDELRILGIDEVILTHVINIQSSKIVNVEQFKKSNREKLEKVKEEIEEKGLNVKIKIPVGEPAAEIDKLAHKEDVALILMASHGEGFIKKVFLGSTTYDLIRQTTKPVLIEKFENIEGEAKVACARKFNRILLPIDFSECSTVCTDFINNLKQQAEEIILLHVVESSSSDEELKELKLEAEDKLKKIGNDLKENEITDKVSIRVMEGAASDNIIEIAENENIGLILMPKTGKGKIKDLLLGSTSDRVAKESPVPVLLLSGK
ncbi:MAG: universal stress protein [Halarsenatibacteraceae bacterium]